MPATNFVIAYNGESLTSQGFPHSALSLTVRAHRLAHLLGGLHWVRVLLRLAGRDTAATVASTCTDSTSCSTARRPLVVRTTTAVTEHPQFRPPSHLATAGLAGAGCRSMIELEHRKIGTQLALVEAVGSKTKPTQAEHRTVRSVGCKAEVPGLSGHTIVKSFLSLKFCFPAAAGTSRTLSHKGSC